MGESGRSDKDRRVSVGVRVFTGFLIDHCFILFEELGGRVIVEQYVKRR